MKSPLCVAGVLVVAATVLGASIESPEAHAQSAIQADAPDAAAVLAMAERYFRRASTDAFGDERALLDTLDLPVPDFTGKKSDPAAALSLSHPVAFLTSYTDLRNVYVILAATAFSLDAQSPVAAGNLASAIATFAEDLTRGPVAGLGSKNKRYAEDAATIYRYALTLKLGPDAPPETLLPVLLNYGHLAIDLERLDTARGCFEGALRIAPDYLPACEGMAAYWLAVGRPLEAAAVLKKARPGAFFGVLARSGESSTDEKAPPVEESDDPALLEQKLAALREVPVLLATDFYEDLDPKGAADAREFVKELAAEWRYTAPNINFLLQYSDATAVSSGHGKSALQAFQNEVMTLAARFAKSTQAHGVGFAGRAIGQLVPGVDLQDVIDNPRNYRRGELGKKLRAAGIMQNAQALRKQVEAGAAGLAEGDRNAIGTIIATVATTSPEIGVFGLDPAQYSNPTDVLTQKYNMAILLKKMRAYRFYFGRQEELIRNVVTEDARRLEVELTRIQARMSEALAAIQVAHDASHGTPCRCTEQIHRVHEQYHPEMNQLINRTFVDASNYAGSRYVQKLKPAVEAMYPDCMRNVMLVSDPVSREKLAREVEVLIFECLAGVLGHVGMAYSLVPGQYPITCDCDLAQVLAQREAIRKAFEEADALKTVAWNRARKEFDPCEIKESSQLYQRLDKYSAEYNFLFLRAKWHPLKTTATLGVKLPIKPGVDLVLAAKRVEDHVRNTATNGGGLGVALSGDVRNAKVSGFVGLQGEVTTDGQGNVLRSDFGGKATVAVAAGGLETTTTFEVSSMRGCRLSAEVTRLLVDTLKPPGAPAAWDDFMEVIGLFQEDKPKKVLWTGEFQLAPAP